MTRPEESYRLWCVVVCDLETSWIRRPWPALGRSATKKKTLPLQLDVPAAFSSFSTQNPCTFCHKMCNKRHNLLFDMCEETIEQNIKKVKVKWSCYRPGVAQTVGRSIALLFHDSGTRRGELSAVRPGRLYPRERPCTHCTGGWVDPRAGLDGRKISSPPGFDPRPSSP